MEKKLAAIILAAGKGTRMKSPTPKVMHTVAGKPLVSHVASAALDVGCNKLVLVVSEDMEQVSNEIKNIFPNVASVIQKEQLGTAHAVKVTKESFDNFEGDFLILYGDTPFIKPDTLQKMLGELGEKSIIVLGFSLEGAGQYGRLIVNKNNELEEIVEYKDASDKQKKIKLCNSGVMAVDGKILFDVLEEIDNKNAKGEYYLTDIISISRKKGYKCGVIECDENEVLGINSQEERAMAEKIAQEELRKKIMENGVTLIAPETVFLCSDTQIGEGTVIHPNVVFGKNVKIGKSVEIKPFSHIEDAVVEDNASIGPFARLRPGAQIGKEARVGNFVEVKNSKIGKGSKINHLSYVGDAEIGEDSNIGAGTITCNYDGFTKHKTEIGNNVSVGSNTSLIAPVKVGDGAIIGAGTTVIKDVGADELAINKLEQENRPGSAKEYRDKKSG